jgi:ADP-heptose:LPS heptosyltransferase
MVFRGNPNIAPPTVSNASNLEWIAFYKGCRRYNSQGDGRWIWNYEFRAIPGEIFLSRKEKNYADLYARGSILIEPNVPTFKLCSPNKQWPVERYEQLSARLRADGHSVIQFSYPGAAYRLAGVQQIRTSTFRHALAVLANAALYIGPEGGLHHGAAAVSTLAVVLFGGFVPPAVTGYDTHTNLTGGAEACGLLKPCPHCFAAMQAISVDEVYAAATERLASR